MKMMKNCPCHIRGGSKQGRHSFSNTIIHFFVTEVKKKAPAEKDARKEAGAKVMNDMYIDIFDRSIE